MNEGDELEETYSVDPKDNHQDMPVDDDAEKEEHPNELDPMVIMAILLNETEDKISLQENAKKTATWKDTNHCDDSISPSDNVEEVYLPSHDKSRSLSTKDLRTRLNVKREKARFEKVRPREDGLRNYINDLIYGRESLDTMTQCLEWKIEELTKLSERISLNQIRTVSNWEEEDT
uniref:Uncharacterized protein n=1 Tax=Cannabis sativa TaxID=3483 RepID=A0A803QDN2_CANSA